MPWTYASASFVGDKADPQPGASVTVTIQEASDPENVQTRELTWGFDGKKTKAQFVVMVKGEVRAYLQHLDAGGSVADVSSEFEPG